MVEMVEMVEMLGNGIEKIDSNNNANKNVRQSSRIAEKYSLRPRTLVKRLQLERNLQEAALQGPRKPKAQPLSKYRRKTANARERHRMKEINEAFATLRGILPSFVSRRCTASMTKITTLKMAASYIQALSEVLSGTHSEERIDSRHPAKREAGSSHGLPRFGLPTTGLYCHGSDRSSSFCSSNGSSICDLLSDDSCAFDSNIDAFDDIAGLHDGDSFGLLLDNADASTTLPS